MKVQIIIGSTRPGRVSDRVAAWVASEVGAMTNTKVEVLDLADFNLPFFDETVSPQYNQNRTPNEMARKWLSKLAEAEAYIIVTPEYNRSCPGVLKNALDYIGFQIAKKPVAIVAHGTNGGAQAVSHLRGIIPGLLAITVPKATYLNGRAGEMIDEAGVMREDYKSRGLQGSLTSMLDDLRWYSDALSVARAE